MTGRVVTIGNFDGVHAGHRRIMRRVVEIAKANGWAPTVVTFDPHPARVLAPERAPKLMTTITRRSELMKAEGIEEIVVLPFTLDIARLTAEEFVDRILCDRLNARAVLVGENFRFGAKKAGDAALLSSLGGHRGFTTEVVPPVCRRGRTVSSSVIRELVGQGKVGLAGRLLERPFSLDGSIVSGHGVGSKQTVPTLNLSQDTDLIPATGVYITRSTDLEHPSRRWDSITNVGYRPTFGGEEHPTIETFLLGPLDEPSPGRIRLEFLRRVREERKFESPEALKAQIFRDVAVARRYLRRLAALAPAELKTL